MICATALVAGRAGTAAAENDTPFTSSRDGALTAQRARQTQAAALTLFQVAQDSATSSAPVRYASQTEPPLEEPPARPQGESAGAAPGGSSAAAPPGRVQFRGTLRYVLPPPGSSVTVPPAASADVPADESANTAVDTMTPPNDGERLEQVDPFFLGTPIGQLGVDVEPKTDSDLKETMMFPESRTAEKFAQFGTIRYGIMSYRPVASPAPVLGSADFCHQPLYFEDAPLERYGQTVGILQPVVSGLRFFGTVPLIPYKTVVERPRQCLTYPYPYEAGRRAPRFRNRYPVRLDAAVVETLAVAGLIAAML